ncbi:MAG: hypothetical protein H3C47_01400 [Candidatus Cloacimonetes bacterium]|nr:hypothetical protein [Candidatus Cloacimonadota bacterium]
MESSMSFHFLGQSKNLLRPVQGSEVPTTVLTPRYSSNLYPARMVYRQEGETENSNSSMPSQSMDTTGQIRRYSEADFVKAVEVIRDLISAEQKFSDYEEASVCYTLFEMQAASPAPIAGFFEMLRDVDPNRGRSFRKHLIEQLQLYFPDRPVAKLITEALSREWKESQKSGEKKEAKARVANSETLDQLVQFNRNFYKWNNLFRALKRKREGSVDTSKFAVLNKVKDAYFGHAMVYMLSGHESSDSDFRSELGNTYYQFKTENKPIFDMVLDPNANPMELQKVLAFLRCIYFGLLVTETLCNYVNILKLEGPSAQSLCPDKKKFILGHLKRFQKTVLDANLTQNPSLLQVIDVNFTAQGFKELVYNRNDCIVKYTEFFLDKRYLFHFGGKTDNITALKVSREG